MSSNNLNDHVPDCLGLGGLSAPTTGEREAGKMARDSGVVGTELLLLWVLDLTWFAFSDGILKLPVGHELILRGNACLQVHYVSTTSPYTG